MPTPLGYGALIARFHLQVPALRQTFWLGERSAETRTQAADGSERIELARSRASTEGSTVEQLTFALKLSRRKRDFVSQLTDEELLRVQEVVSRNFGEYIDARL